MPTVSQVLLRQKGRAQRSPKLPHKRPPVPRVAELLAGANSMKRSWTNDNTPFIPKLSLKQKGEHALSAETTRDISDHADEFNTEDRQSVDYNNSKYQAEQTFNNDDENNKMFHCVFSDGSKRVLSLSQLNYLQICGNLPTESASVLQQQPSAKNGLSASIVEQQKQIMEHLNETDLRDLPHVSSNQIGASQQHAGQMQKETEMVTRLALRPQLGSEQYHQQYYSNIERPTWQTYYQPNMNGQMTEFNDTRDQRLFLKPNYAPSEIHPSSHHIESMNQLKTKQLMKQGYVQDYFSQQSPPQQQLSEAQQQNIRKCTINSVSNESLSTIGKTFTLPQHLQWINSGMNNSLFNEGMVSYNPINESIYGNRPFKLQEEGTVLMPVSTIPEPSQFPTPPKDPTNPEELKRYHENVDAFLKQQNEKMLSLNVNKAFTGQQASQPLFGIPSSYIGPNLYKHQVKGIDGPTQGFQDTKVSTRSRSLPAMDSNMQQTAQNKPGLLRKWFDQLTGGRYKRAGTILECLSCSSQNGE